MFLGGQTSFLRMENMLILNLGCGTKTNADTSVVNIDWSMYLRIKMSPLLRRIAPFFFRGERLRHFNKLPDNIKVHNLAKGIPFETNSVDVVYHSHLLEHLDRDIAEEFLLEARRVLKPGGIHRIVVPDFEKACREYISHVELCNLKSEEREKHEVYIAALLEQSVRKEAYWTRKQKPIRRFFENLILGDARKRGETHQWMYDQISLKALLTTLGYREVYVTPLKKGDL